MVPATSADLGPQPVEQLPQPVPPLNQWQFSFTPYAWLPWISGDVVVKGRPFDVAVDPAQIIDALNWPDIVPVWMSYTEARRGPLSLFNDIVYANVNGGTGFSRTVSGRLATVTLGGNVSADYQLAIVEAGGAYAIWSRGSQGSPGSTVFDLLAGARYWHQDVDISADLTAPWRLTVPRSTISEVAPLRNPAPSIGSTRLSGRVFGSSWRLGRSSCSVATLGASGPVVNFRGRQLPPTTRPFVKSTASRSMATLDFALCRQIFRRVQVDPNSNSTTSYTDR
jgi:hypothetical protein